MEYRIIWLTFFVLLFLLGATAPYFPEGELILLSIPRAKAVQQLSFFSYFRMPGTASNMGYGVDQDAHVLKPLRKWLKINIEKTLARH